MHPSLLLARDESIAIIISVPGICTLILTWLLADHEEMTKQADMQQPESLQILAEVTMLAASLPRQCQHSFPQLSTAMQQEEWDTWGHQC